MKKVRPFGAPGREAYAVGIQPSMSRTDLLLECSWWIGQQVEYEGAEEPARYGSAFHLVEANLVKNPDATPAMRRRWIKEAAAKYDVDAVDELSEQIGPAHQTLMAWLDGNNEYKVKFSLKGAWIETAFALKPLESGRTIDPHDKDHRYHGVERGELPGTGDLGIKATKKTPLLVLDHKTGEEDFAFPLDKPQLLAEAAAAMRATGESECIVGANHARRRGMAKVYTEKVKLTELRGFETRLRVALDKVGEGSMRPGPWCKRCPAQTVCPARDADLLNKAGDVLTGLTVGGGVLSKGGLAANDLVVAPQVEMTKDKKIGLLNSIIRKAEAIAKRGREEIRAEMLADPSLLPITPEGEYLVIRRFKKESVSKQSIIDAYGKLQAAKVIEKLRRDGAINITDVVAVYPEKEKGGRG